MTPPLSIWASPLCVQRALVVLLKGLRARLLTLTFQVPPPSVWEKRGAAGVLVDASIA